MRKRLRKYQLGSTLGAISDTRLTEPLLGDLGNPAPTSMPPPTLDLSTPQVATPRTRRTIDWGGIADNVTPFVSNITNAFYKLPTPKAPQLESQTAPELVNFNADRAQLRKEIRGINKGLELANPNPSVANALKVGNLGKYLDARAQLAQNERNTNAEITNRFRMFNQQVGARNKDRVNAYQQQLTARQIANDQFQQQNIADAVNKLQLRRRDKDMMNLENRKLDILPQIYRDSGVLDRNLTDNLRGEYYPKRFGGKLSTYLKHGRTV
jgi:hypothetical protein